ncbi:putative xyloglucan-specific endo-beta-1,4-glucanase A [Neolecta irregularis DAH-3]|uniref:Putative xyloglucan-specific endo-beta-1,4-glucanase A n=1 Tax=Neolecta irregularis (strain DAH-3) TaxID=1198029 RepID=A0A1U7LJU2_NEOID|nr:putative xyloglucan-specific endo-beta-1,4-glucanase A [Neolecta irregularis DAH-3]|eukprot:OLL22925.1 putative xyloglucan-specific endo-beta-1,4-glucanase A [Neolecta irregularis DAH-3]
MFFSTFFYIATSFVFAACVPMKKCNTDQTTRIADYLIQNTLGGADGFTGSQCLAVDSSETDPISFGASWSWDYSDAGKHTVKSYSNAVRLQDAPIPVTKITSMPSSWSWEYSGEGVVADVTYDLLFSPTPKPAQHQDNLFEIMIWLGQLGDMFPLSYPGSVAEHVTVAGRSWLLYRGIINTNQNVISFIRMDGDIKDYQADINEFVKHCIDKEHLPTDYYMLAIGGGSEAVTGKNAYFQTKSYSVKINQG